MRFRAAFFTVFAIAILAACGGGGGGGVTPTTAPSATPTPTPVPSSTSVPASTATAQPAVVAAGGTTATVTVPAASSGSGTIAVAASATLPSGLAPLARVRQSTCTATFANFYMTFTPSAAITLSAIPSFSVTLPSSISTSGVNFYIAYLAPGASAWKEPFLGPATLSGQTLTFTGTSTPFAMSAGSQYAFALYTESSACVPPASFSGIASYATQPSTVSATMSGSVSGGTISGSISGKLNGTAFNGTVSGTVSGSTASGTISGTGFSGTFTGPVTGNAFAAGGTLTFTSGNVVVAVSLWGTTATGGQNWYVTGLGSCGDCPQPDQINGGFAVDSVGNVAFGGQGLSVGSSGYCVQTGTAAGTFANTTLSFNGTLQFQIGTSAECGATSNSATGTANAAFPNATSVSASGIDNKGNAFCFAAERDATPAPCVLPTPTASPSPAAAVFTGGTTTQSCSSSGCTLTMNAADNGYSASTSWGTNNASAPFNLTMSWATFAQIQGTFVPGALPSSIGTALLYLDLNPTATVQFSQTPGISVTTSTTFPGTSCGFAAYTKVGSETSNQWNSMTQFGISEVAPSGNTFTVSQTTLPAPNTVDLKGSSDLYIALYCH